MPVLFEGTPGRVTALQDPTVQGVIPPLVTMQPEDLTFQGQKSIITHLTLGLSTNHQFMHTLGGDIYIYVFGDRIGQVGVSGLCFAADCDGGDNEHGIEKVIQWYNRNKLSRRRDPVTVLVGFTPIRGFLCDVQFGTFDHKLRLIQYTLGLHVIPDKE